MKTIDASNKIIREKDLIVLERTQVRELSLEEYNDYVKEMLDKKKSIEQVIHQLKLRKEMTPKFKNRAEEKEVMQTIERLKDRRFAELIDSVWAVEEANKMIEINQMTLDAITKETDGLSEIEE